MKLEIRHLTKSYTLSRALLSGRSGSGKTAPKSADRKKPGRKVALKRVDLTLTEGIYALLGPNGAGKSTLINLITGSLTPDHGEILYNGKPVGEIGRDFRAILGFMPQQQGIYENFTAYQFLSYIASLKGMKQRKAAQEIQWALEKVHLTKEAHQKLGTFSGGMKQRVLIAQAMMNHPEVLILDEPTAGLDPKERIRIRNIISEIAMDKIVIFATHVVSDVEQIAKEVILLKNGKVAAMAPPDVLCGKLEGKVFEAEMSQEEFETLESRILVRNVAKRNGKLLVRFLTRKTSGKWDGCGVRPDLEDVYLYYFANRREQG